MLGLLDFAVSLDSWMAATLTLCASRKMLSSVCLLPIPLAFHCSMLNVLSDMVGMWGGSRRWGRHAWLWWRHTGGTDPAIGFTIVRSVSKTRTSWMYPMRTSCTQVTGTLASDVFDADRAGGTLTVLGSGAHHRLGLTVEVVDHNRVRWSAAQLSNESSLPRTTDSTPLKNSIDLTKVLDGWDDSNLPEERSSSGQFHHVQAGVAGT